MVVEADAEVWVVPADHRLLHLARDEAEVVAHLVEVERLVGNDRIDAEAACVGAPETADHGDYLDQRRLLERRFDVLPARPYSRQGEWLHLGRHVAAQRAVRLAVVQHFVQRGLVGEAEHVVEVLLRILRIAARVRPADAGDGTAPAEHLADRIGELGPLGEGARRRGGRYPPGGRRRGPRGRCSRRGSRRGRPPRTTRRAPEA